MHGSGKSAGDMTYLTTGKMIGTEQKSQSWSYFTDMSHTCNYVNNDNNGAGGLPQNENSYIVIKLPYYL